MFFFLPPQFRHSIHWKNSMYKHWTQTKGNFLVSPPFFFLSLPFFVIVLVAVAFIILFSFVFFCLLIFPFCGRKKKFLFKRKFLHILLPFRTVTIHTHTLRPHSKYTKKAIRLTVLHTYACIYRFVRLLIISIYYFPLPFGLSWKLNEQM